MSTLPYRWRPDSAAERTPKIGDLVPNMHKVYRVIEVNPVPEVDWTDEDHAAVNRYRPEHRAKYAPLYVVLAEVRPGQPDAPGRHYRIGGGLHTTNAVFVYPHGDHYPMCGTCLEPMPCRHLVAERIGEDVMRRMARYETAGVCPACGEVITARQERVTWQDNIEVLGGPPVTYHSGRRTCRYSAAEYEKRWVAQDPERRRATLSCTGHITNHNDGTYECTQLGECPGPGVTHPGYSVCRCPDCHARGQFSCYPSVNAARTGGDT